LTTAQTAFFLNVVKVSIERSDEKIITFSKMKKDSTIYINFLVPE